MPISTHTVGFSDARVRRKFRVIALAIASSLSLANAQEERRSKLPGIEKITTGTPRQAFSGIVQSVDLKRKLLNVDAVQGQSTEIFPISKGTRVATANGERLKPQQLSPGTNVIVYYEQAGDQRKVKEIIVLVAGTAQAKKSRPPT